MPRVVSQAKAWVLPRRPLERLRPLRGVEAGDLALEDLLEALAGHVAVGPPVVPGGR